MGADLVTIASLQIDLITEEGYSCNFPSLPSIRSVQNTKHATQDRNKSNGAHEISLSVNEKQFNRVEVTKFSCTTTFSKSSYPVVVVGLEYWQLWPDHPFRSHNSRLPSQESPQGATS